MVDSDAKAIEAAMEVAKSNPLVKDQLSSGQLRFEHKKDLACMEDLEQVILICSLCFCHFFCKFIKVYYYHNSYDVDLM